MKIKQLICLSFLFIAFCPLSNALTFDEYIHAKKGSTEEGLQNVLLVGTANGFIMANKYLELHNKAPIFCSNDAMPFNVNNYRSIIDNEIKLGHYENADDVEILLLMQLIKIFPCK